MKIHAVMKIHEIAKRENNKTNRNDLFRSARSPKDLTPESLCPSPPGPSASYGQIYRVKPGLACPSLSIKVRGLERVPK